MKIGSVNFEDLERRFDGPIPRHLLRIETERDLEAGHHRAMIRFSETRIADFTESLARLQATPPFPGRTAWIERTQSIIADHESEKRRHQAALAARGL